MADINTIATEFTQFFYTTFDSNRSGLASLYRDGTMFTWEDKQFSGVNNILEHLQNLPFTKVQHQVGRVDAQPSMPGQSSILVLVTGHLVVDDSPNPLAFSETFHLIPEGGSYYVQNDIFRLILG